MSDDEFKIEKGVPVPPRTRIALPFDKLEPGDSFLVPTTTLKYESVQARVSNEGRRLHPKRFRARQTDDKKGTRVWRIEDAAASPSEPSQTQ